MVVTCYPFLHIRCPSAPLQAPSIQCLCALTWVSYNLTNLKSLSDRSHSRLTVRLTAQPHALRAPGSIALWLSFPGLVSELGFVSGVECLDNCALGLIDLGLDLEHHGLVDW